MTTTFPCIRGRIGDWAFYNTCIRMSELINYVKFADEIFPRGDLDQIMQRELTKRSEAITQYLLNNEQRFLGSLIVAAVGGEPQFVPISFGDESGYNFAEGKLGFLRFNGSENFYALDGQHRLAAIRDAMLKDPDRLSNDEVSLIIVWYENNGEGRTRARRLFTTVNRYARKTSKADDLLFDEDNPVDIFTRRLIREDTFFKERTKVTNLERQGEFSLTKSEALRPEDSYDRNFLFSLLTLRRCNEILLQKCFTDQNVKPQVLPEFDIMEKGYGILLDRWQTLLSKVPIWKALKQDKQITLDGYRFKNGGDPLSRPIAIIAFIEAAAVLLDNNGSPDNLSKVANYFNDLTKAPFKGLLWKEGVGGMHDGQTRRKAVAALYGYYLNDSPKIDEAKRKWESATGRLLDTDLPERDAIL